MLGRVIPPLVLQRLLCRHGELQLDLCIFLLERVTDFVAFCHSCLQLLVDTLVDPHLDLIVIDDLELHGHVLTLRGPGGDDEPFRLLSVLHLKHAVGQDGQVSLVGILILRQRFDFLIIFTVLPTPTLHAGR